MRKDRVLTTNPRIQAQILNFDPSRLLWINSYLPNDPLTVEFDEEELLEVLTEIEQILDNTQFDDVLWCGDLNWEMTRQTGFSVTVRTFLDRLGLTSLWEHHEVDYTHVHTDDKSFTSLDHFVCNERLLPLVKDCGVCHFGDNNSRHSPIVVKLDMGALPLREKTSEVKPRRPAWYKASEVQIAKYKADLRGRLQAIPVPACLDCSDVKCESESHTRVRDDFVLDNLSAVIEASHATIPMVGGRPGSVRPDSGVMPGWQDVVALQQKDSVFWHSVWQSAGRPSSGELYHVMRSTRAKYHTARKATDKIKAQKLFEASSAGGSDLFKEMKKSHGGKHSPGLPENVAGANGEEEICEKFRTVYSTLYNSADSSDKMTVVKQRIEEGIKEDSSMEAEKITCEVVKMAAVTMKKCKGDVSGSFTSDAIRNAPDILFENLASVFRSWLYHGTVTRSLLACAFIPLLKSSLKDPGKTKSYRAIAGSSLWLKLFDRVILIVWGHLLVSGSLQMGYKKKSSTAQCSYVMMETVSYYLNHGSNPIMVALDMSSAFDKCRFDIMFSKLEKRIPAIVIRTLIFSYEQQYAWVKWGNNSKSRIFSISNGTKQGSVLSPALFSVYVQDLLYELKELCVGCHVGETFLGDIAWADDFLFLAPHRAAMQQMLDVAADFGRRNNLEFSCDPDPAKTKSKAIFMVGKKTALRKPVNLQLYGKPLPWVAHATHLGHEFHEDGSMNMDAGASSTTRARKIMS